MKKELTNKINGYLANVAVSYVKLHNLHWNVTGCQFKAVHEYLESLYDSFAEVLDAVAEILKMNGETPLASMKDYLAVATIEELESKDFDIKGTLGIVLKDVETLKAQAEDIRAEAGEADQYDVANMMEDDLANYSKTIWFLRSMMK
ncbi:MAG: DNA starvation/stationary phase protection protein [Clostridia bacterium]|nr:DNA starvation/stationary phase protection protein [Clostridia bacterium]